MEAWIIWSIIAVVLLIVELFSFHFVALYRRKYRNCLAVLKEQKQPPFLNIKMGD